MFLPTLRAIAKSVDRKISEPTVTELLCGIRETYLKKTTDYAVDPMQQLYAIHGSAVHTINEGHTEGNMLSEERLADNVTSGKFDLYGQIIDYSDKTPWGLQNNQFLQAYEGTWLLQSRCSDRRSI